LGAVQSGGGGGRGGSDLENTANTVASDRWDVRGM
jgi:hypothetical protein